MIESEHWTLRGLWSANNSYFQFKIRSISPAIKLTIILRSHPSWRIIWYYWIFAFAGWLNKILLNCSLHDRWKACFWMKVIDFVDHMHCVYIVKIVRYLIFSLWQNDVLYWPKKKTEFQMLLDLLTFFYRFLHLIFFLIYISNNSS